MTIKKPARTFLIKAFLQRIVNGCGRINREYGLGRKRTDLAIEWPVGKEKGYYGPVQRIVIELKILQGDLERIIAKGMEQTTEYAKSFNADEAHLIIFNRAPDVSWDEEIWFDTCEDNDHI